MTVKNITSVTIFNGIMVLMGVYLLLVTIDMKKNNKLPSLLLAEEELKKIKKPEAFIAEIYKDQLAFSIIMAVLGLAGFLCDILQLCTWFKFVEVFAFPAAMLRFTMVFRNAREKYIRPF